MLVLNEQLQVQLSYFNDLVVQLVWQFFLAWHTDVAQLRSFIKRSINESRPAFEACPT